MSPDNHDLTVFYGKVNMEVSEEETLWKIWGAGGRGTPVVCLSGLKADQKFLDFARIQLTMLE